MVQMAEKRVILSVQSASKVYRMGEVDVPALRDATLEIHEASREARSRGELRAHRAGRRPPRKRAREAEQEEDRDVEKRPGHRALRHPPMLPCGTRG